MIDKNDYSLLSHNTFCIDARCKRFMEFSSVEELKEISDAVKKADMPVLIIGSGSNMLFIKDFDGIVLHSTIKGFQVISTTDQDSVRVRCGSGEVWDNVVKECVEKGFYGAENLSLIPGEVGATAVQNIGAYGVEAKDIIDEVEVYDISSGETIVFNNSECHFDYRDSIFKHEKKNEYVVTYITYRLSKSFRPILDYGNIKRSFSSEDLATITAKQLREAIIKIRKEKLPDPKVLGNAGSFFKNPIINKADFQRIADIYPDAPHFVVGQNEIKIPAGWLIEQCGWKGKSMGNAAVHDRQALVLVNKGGASGAEICSLARQIVADVRSKFGINIKPEVNVIG